MNENSFKHFIFDFYYIYTLVMLFTHKKHKLQRSANQHYAPRGIVVIALEMNCIIPHFCYEMKTTVRHY